MVTIQRAIEWVDTFCKNYEIAPDDVKDEVDTARGLAIRALERQIEKKPISIENMYGGALKAYCCPMCGLTWRGFENSAHYCINCGQAIDWKGGGENAAN